MIYSVSYRRCIVAIVLGLFNIDSVIVSYRSTTQYHWFWVSFCFAWWPDSWSADVCRPSLVWIMYRTLRNSSENTS